MLTPRLYLQQTPPADALLEWKRTSKKITGQIIIVVKSEEIEANRGSGQGKAKHPELQAVVKPAFNQHAVREPGMPSAPAQPPWVTVVLQPFLTKAGSHASLCCPYHA